MPGYRLYFIDAFSGHIEHRREFLADCDADAIATAEGWNSGQPMELWQGARKVRRWDKQSPR
jgi:hypothetical protein